MTAVTASPASHAEHPAHAAKPGAPIGPRVASWASQLFMIVMTVLWITPIVFALYVALRPISETNKLGYVSLPHHLTLSNFADAWSQSGMWKFFLNSAYVTVPSVLLALFLASCVAYVVSRLSFAFNIPLLILFTAGNLLPQQVIITPLYRIYLALGIYNSYLGLILINLSFQLGFCVFVLSNFMKSVPLEIDEAALLDGASLWTRYWRLTLPLCRPALAALATLLVTWVYNDFFWAITLISTGDKRPITSALANLQGQFVANQNLIAAAALIAAIPTVLIYVLLQKQFIAGLSLGSTKG
ncbi:carbohydrate ABC transporter permease [Actinoplanes sp. NPDC051411]|uniref:carbohydrate ABC transporter permease n=1 Tax=Actinoplanes sp. NPDC051411 TaxID=3155522 RepID=UPI003437BF85